MFTRGKYQDDQENNNWTNLKTYDFVIVVLLSVYQVLNRIGTYGARHFAENHFAEKTFRRNDTKPKILLRCDTSPKVLND